MLSWRLPWSQESCGQGNKQLYSSNFLTYLGIRWKVVWVGFRYNEEIGCPRVVLMQPVANKIHMSVC